MIALILTILGGAEITIESILAAVAGSVGFFLVLKIVKWVRNR